MQIDPLFLIAIGGMVLAVVVIAVFMGRDKHASEVDSQPAKAELTYKDDQAQLQRYFCPECGQLLRQEVQLSTPKPHRQTAKTESGFSTGDVVCPKCGSKIRINPGTELLA